MSLDLRPITTNATQQTLHEILEDHAIRAEILWSFIILLHFAALLPLNPMLVHAFVVLLNWATAKARPVLENRTMVKAAMLTAAEFYEGLAQRLSLDSSIGVQGI